MGAGLKYTEHPTGSVLHPVSMVTALEEFTVMQIWTLWGGKSGQGKEQHAGPRVYPRALACPEARGTQQTADPQDMLIGKPTDSLYP